MQARLCIDTRTSWLARYFTAEYAGHFDVVLPKLAALGLPLPLGGSSNHFRTVTLREVGGWDPHNVTEDADLGMVLLPSAVPSIFAGVRLGLGVSIILVVAAEMVVGKVGLGARLYLAGQVLETEQVFAVLIVLAILGVAVTKAQDFIDVRLNQWRLS